MFQLTLEDWQWGKPKLEMDATPYNWKVLCCQPSGPTAADLETSLQGPTVFPSVDPRSYPLTLP